MSSSGRPSRWGDACPTSHWSRPCGGGWRRKTRRRTCSRISGWPNWRACCLSCACVILISRPPPRMNWGPRCGSLKRWRACWTPWRSEDRWCCCWMTCSGRMGPPSTCYTTWVGTGRGIAHGCCCWVRCAVKDWSPSRSFLPS